MVKFVAVGLGIFLAAASAAAFAQQPPSGGLTLNTTSRLTIVDVTVTDAAGKPVHGFTQADFTLDEDHHPQKLSSFEEVAASRAAGAGASALPADVHTNQPGAAEVAMDGAANILLVDDLNTPPSNRMVMKGQVVAYLKQMPEGTRVAILELGTSLRIIQGFTTNREQLAAAMDSISSKTVTMGSAAMDEEPAPEIASPKFVSIGPGGSAVHMGGPGSGTGGSGGLTARQVCSTLDELSATTTSVLQAVARYAGRVSGRKNLIWFTTGVPQITSFGSISAYLPSGCLTDYAKELHKAYDQLIAARVAVYPVDPRGVGLVMASRAISIGGSNGYSIDPQMQRDSESDIADATGGTAYFNRNDLDGALAEAIATGSDYYTLAYVPPGVKFDGRYHTISVKVNRPGVKLEYRRGYTADDAGTPVENSASVETSTGNAFHDVAMHHGQALASGIIFKVQADPATGPAKPGAPAVMGEVNPAIKGRPLVRYDVHYDFPASELTFTDGPDGAKKGSVEFDIAAYDEDGRLMSVLRQTANFSLKPEAAAHLAELPFRFAQQIDLPVGKGFVRVGVLDVATQKAGSVEFPVTVVK